MRRSPGSSLACAMTVAVVLLGACGMPRDPEGTFKRVSGGTLRVGYAHADPWVIAGPGEPRGIEPELVRMFADDIDAEIEWTEGSESAVIEALELRELDLVVAGLTSTTPWSGMVALTHPYVTTQSVIAAPEGNEVPEDIAGREVAVEEGTPVAGLVEKTDAVPVEVPDVADAEGLVAVDDWLLEDLGLNETGVVLEERDHVMATPMGENRMLIELEKFLLDRPQVVKDLLEAQEP